MTVEPTADGLAAVTSLLVNLPGQTAKLLINQGCRSGSAFIFPPGTRYGSGRKNLKNNDRKNAEKLAIIVNLLILFK